MYDAPLVVTGYAHERAADQPIPIETTWQALAASLSVVRETDCQPWPCTGKGDKQLKIPECPMKYGRAWSPVRLTSSHRLNNNVAAVTAFAVDFDDITNAELISVLAKLNGYEFVMHSTHSHLHGGPGHNSLRVALPVSREITPEEWPRVWGAAIADFDFPYEPPVLLPEKKRARGADRQCKDPSRLWFMPTRPRGREYISHRGEGRPLDVDRLLALAPVVVPVALPAPVASTAPRTPIDDADVDDTTPLDEDAQDLSTLRKRLIRLRRRKGKSTDPKDTELYRLLTALLEGTPLGWPNHPDHPRSASVNRAASLLAHGGLPLGTPWEVAIEVMRPAMSAMEVDPDGGPEDLQHWFDVAEESYNRAMARAFVHAKERAEFLEREEMARNALLMAAPPTPASPTLPSPSGEGSSASATPGFHDILASTVKELEGPDAWMSQFIRGADQKTVLACGHNVYIILKHAPALKGTIRFNKVTKDIEVQGGPFAGTSPEVFSIALTNWLHKAGRLRVNKGEVEDQIMLVARENAYDPIVDRLNGVVWDEQPRLDDFFMGLYAKCRTKTDTGACLVEHLRRISSKFFISAVARAYEPGCQVDTMLVLEGPKEGEGKSELLRRLFNPYYIVVRFGNMDAKDAQMVGSSNWGCEMGELVTLKKSDDDLVKTYLDTRVEKYRPPYGRRFVAEPRRCVFAGTTNAEKWLTPGKGKRRYWPIFIEEVYLDKVSKDVDQIWAEAVFRYRQGERWHLLSDERKAADAEAIERMEDSYIEHRIAEWWTGLRPERRAEPVRLTDIVDLALKISPERAATKNLQMDISNAMTRLGFNKGRLTVPGSKYRPYVWYPTREMGEAPPQSHLRLVRAVDEDASHAEYIAEARAKE